MTLETHLINSEASHVFVKMKQTLCANMPKKAPQQLQRVDKEQFKIKLLQTIQYVKLTFMQEEIPRQNAKFNFLW